MCVFFEGLVHSSEYYMQSIIELYIGEGVKESVGANERRRRVSGVDRRVRRLSATLISLPTQQKKKMTHANQTSQNSLMNTTQHGHFRTLFISPHTKIFTF